MDVDWEERVEGVERVRREAALLRTRSSSLKTPWYMVCTLYQNRQWNKWTRKGHNGDWDEWYREHSHRILGFECSAHTIPSLL